MANALNKLVSAVRRVPLKQALIVYAAVITVAAVALTVALVMTNASHSESAAEAARKEKIRDTQLALYDKPQTTVDGSRLYFPEMKLAIPATTTAQPLLYRFVASTFADGGTTTPESAEFASRTAIYNSAKPEGDERCNVLAEISIGKKFNGNEHNGLSIYASQKLADGRTIFIYLNKSDCSEEWGDLDSAAIANLLKQAEAYAPGS